MVNLAATWCSREANRASLNVEGAFQHILTDLFGFVATAVAGAVVMLTGFARADGDRRAARRRAHAPRRLRPARAPRAGSSSRPPPRGLDPDVIGRALAALPGVAEVHDLHVWEVTSGFPALSAHVVVGRDTDCHAARRELQVLLHERFGIEHTHAADRS